MKKYIVLIALIAAVGCGSLDKDKRDIITTETTTEFEFDTVLETKSDNESMEVNDEYEQEEISVETNSVSENIENLTETAKKESFEDSETYTALKSLASQTGFDISYNNNTVTFKTYITDDTIDYIKEKDADYYNKWNENCGLYEEFCSEAVRTVRNSDMTDINISLEVVGRSDNQVYFKNENGVSIYDGYMS